jgi:hypothetical protein
MLGVVAVHAHIIGPPCGKPKLPVARFTTPPQNDGMRSNQLLALACVGAVLSLPLASPASLAQNTTIYRCETEAGISLQSKPCPKGAKQTRRSIARPAEPIPPAPNAPPAAAASAPPPGPITAVADIRGPNDPYLLWQCMRADGSTFESRDGVPGKQWVVKPENSDSTGDAVAAPAQITTPAKEPIRRPVESAEVVDAAAAPVDLTPPPAGAAAGAWVADQCTRLEPQQACERYAARRDELRKQIYAAMPSERVKYAPEEQDLTKMLFAACGR